MTVEEEIKFQKELFNQGLKNIQIYKLAIKGLLGELAESDLNRLIDIAGRIHAEISTLNTTETIIKNLEQKQILNLKGGK